MTVTSSSAPANPLNELDTKYIRIRQRVAGRLQQGFHSEFKGYGLRRDLTHPLERPKAKIPLSIRPLTESDIDFILPLGGGGSASENQEITWRRHFYRKAPQGCCFVAVDLRNGTPCYLQWLIGSEHNETLSRFKCFPRLEKDEALLEQAYTMPSHRGLGIMSAAMTLIAERASDLGARYVLTFVGENGIASLKACRRAGFDIHLLHKRTQIGYGTIVYNSFKKLAAEDPRRTMVF